MANDRRLNDELGLGIGSVIDLGDTLLDDLDAVSYGIGWWTSYPALSRKTRILISDYLVACARDVATNLLQAHAYRLEFDHALDDFKEYMKREIRRNAAARLRLRTRLLDGCIVGVAGLPTDIVRTSLHQAKETIASQSHDARLSRL